MNSQTDVAAALRCLIEPGTVFEIRIPEPTNAYGTQSGYFDDFAAAAKAATTWSGKCSAVYITPNPVAPALLARAHNRIKKLGKKDSTTADPDISARRWMLVDLDPVRPAGISSSDAEHAAALVKAEQIRDWLTAQGWGRPVLADSGNGAHLLYRVDLPNDSASKTLIESCLKALAEKFDDRNGQACPVKVDTGVFNAARIWKLYGTLAAKGDHTPDRPHRLARILEAPDQPDVVTVDQLRTLAALAPQPEPKAQPQGAASFGTGSDFFKTVNAQAISRLSDWIPVLFPDARPYRNGYRVTSKALTRDLEEDLSIQPDGIVDFGVHDLGDPGQGRRTPIDLVIEVKGGDAKDAALWLCDQLRIDPATLGWKGSFKPRTKKTKGGTSYSVGNTGNKVTGLNDKENTCYPIEEDWVTKVTTPRPYYFMIHLDGHKEGGIGLKTEELDEGDPRKPGLWYVGTQKEMTPEGETIVHSEPVWVSVPFETLATADDGRGHGYCIAVRFQALHGHQHTWPIPRALLVTEGHEILHRLYAMGFRAMNRPAKANDHLRNYLNSAHPERRALAVSKTGWADSRFVLPDRVFGADRESIFYQVDDPRPSPYTTKGTPAGWRDRVAKVIEPYDLPVFSVSCAFAAPLLSLLDIPSGGFHFMGTSTTGKTTTQNWGLSVWGKPKDLRHNWHGTKVGFELTAAAYSDAVLMLDEIGQADPREVGDLIYMIFNEAGRMRGNARLTHRSLPRWQLLLLSSGEKSLQQLMQDVGKTPMAGQELRLLHIRADAGDGCGILNGLADPLARVELIRQVDAAVTQHHGHPIQTYLTRLAHPDNLTQAADAAQHVKALMLQFATGITSDEAKRAAQRFALVGFAGELASDWQITGWAAGRATQAAECLFHRWLDQWGTATRHDETTFLEHLDAWLSGNSTGHFAEVDPVTRELTMNAERALTGMRPFFGYVANAQDGRVFYLNAAGWQAMTKGFARSLVIETLTAAGRLEKDPKSNKGRVIRIGDHCTTTRYYVIREAGHAE